MITKDAYDRSLEHTSYDVYVAVPWKTVPKLENGDAVVLAMAAQTKQDVIYLQGTLEQARSYLSAIYRAGGAAVVVPSHYRVWNISAAEGSKLAHAEFARRRNPDHVYGDLSEARDEYLWWEYIASDITAQTAGMIPGVLRIKIDKLDGHVPSKEEYSSWLRMCEP